METACAKSLRQRQQGRILSLRGGLGCRKQGRERQEMRPGGLARATIVAHAQECAAHPKQQGSHRRVYSKEMTQLLPAAPWGGSTREDKSACRERGEEVLREVSQGDVRQTRRCGVEMGTSTQWGETGKPNQ